MELIYCLNSVGKYCRNVILGCERLAFVQSTQKTRREFQHREYKLSWFGLKETLEKHPVNSESTPVCALRQKNQTKAPALVTLHKFIETSNTCCLSSNHTSLQSIILKAHHFPSLKVSSLQFICIHGALNKSSSLTGSVSYCRRHWTEFGIGQTVAQCYMPSAVQNSVWASICLDHWIAV